MLIKTITAKKKLSTTQKLLYKKKKKRVTNTLEYLFNLLVI